MLQLKIGVPRVTKGIGGAEAELRVARKALNTLSSLYSLTLRFHVVAIIFFLYLFFAPLFSLFFILFSCSCEENTLKVWRRFGKWKILLVFNG